MTSAGISADDTLYRRIRLADLYNDEKLGRVRPQKGCFCNDSTGAGMSVYSERLLSQIGKSPEDVLEGHPGSLLLPIPAEILVRHGQVLEPVPGDEGDPCRDAHVEVKGHKSKPLQRELMKLPLHPSTPAPAPGDLRR